MLGTVVSCGGVGGGWFLGSIVKVQGWFNIGKYGIELSGSQESRLAACLPKLGAFASVRAGVSGCCAAGDTVGVIGCRACSGDVFTCTDGAMVWVGTFISEVAIFLAFVASHWFL